MDASHLATQVNTSIVFVSCSMSNKDRTYGVCVRQLASLNGKCSRDSIVDSFLLRATNGRPKFDGKPNKLIKSSAVYFRAHVTYSNSAAKKARRATYYRAIEYRVSRICGGGVGRDAYALLVGVFLHRGTSQATNRHTMFIYRRRRANLARSVRRISVQSVRHCRLESLISLSCPCNSASYKVRPVNYVILICFVTRLLISSR